MARHSAVTLTGENAAVGQEPMATEDCLLHSRMWLGTPRWAIHGSRDEPLTLSWSDHHV
jgi:hypothetical protein